MLYRARASCILVDTSCQLLITCLGVKRTNIKSMYNPNGGQGGWRGIGLSFFEDFDMVRLPDCLHLRIMIEAALDIVVEASELSQLLDRQAYATHDIAADPRNQHNQSQLDAHMDSTIGQLVTLLMTVEQTDVAHPDNPHDTPSRRPTEPQPGQTDTVATSDPHEHSCTILALDLHPLDTPTRPHNHTLGHPRHHPSHTIALPSHHPVLRQQETLGGLSDGMKLRLQDSDASMEQDDRQAITEDSWQVRSRSPTSEGAAKRLAVQRIWDSREKGMEGVDTRRRRRGSEERIEQLDGQGGEYSGRARCRSPISEGAAKRIDPQRIGDSRDEGAEQTGPWRTADRGPRIWMDGGVESRSQASEGSAERLDLRKVGNSGIVGRGRTVVSTDSSTAVSAAARAARGRSQGTGLDDLGDTETGWTVGRTDRHLDLGKRTGLMPTGVPHHTILSHHDPHASTPTHSVLLSPRDIYEPQHDRPMDSPRPYMHTEHEHRQEGLTPQEDSSETATPTPVITVYHDAVTPMANKINKWTLGDRGNASPIRGRLTMAAMMAASMGMQMVAPADPSCQLRSSEGAEVRDFAVKLASRHLSSGGSEGAGYTIRLQSYGMLRDPVVRNLVSGWMAQDDVPAAGYWTDNLNNQYGPWPADASWNMTMEPATGVVDFGCDLMQYLSALEEAFPDLERGSSARKALLMWYQNDQDVEAWLVTVRRLLYEGERDEDERRTVEDVQELLSKENIPKLIGSDTMSEFLKAKLKPAPVGEWEDGVTTFDDVAEWLADHQRHLRERAKNRTGSKVYSADKRSRGSNNCALAVRLEGDLPRDGRTGAMAVGYGTEASEEGAFMGSREQIAALVKKEVQAEVKKEIAPVKEELKAQGDQLTAVKTEMSAGFLEMTKQSTENSRQMATLMGGLQGFQESVQITVKQQAESMEGKMESQLKQHADAMKQALKSYQDQGQSNGQPRSRRNSDEGRQKFLESLEYVQDPDTGAKIPVCRGCGGVGHVKPDCGPSAKGFIAPSARTGSGPSTRPHPGPSQPPHAPAPLLSTHPLIHAVYHPLHVVTPVYAVRPMIPVAAPPQLLSRSHRLIPRDPSPSYPPNPRPVHDPTYPDPDRSKESMRSSPASQAATTRVPTSSEIETKPNRLSCDTEAPVVGVLTPVKHVMPHSTSKDPVSFPSGPHPRTPRAKRPPTPPATSLENGALTQQSEPGGDEEEQIGRSRGARREEEDPTRPCYGTNDGTNPDANPPPSALAQRGSRPALSPRARDDYHGASRHEEHGTARLVATSRNATGAARDLGNLDGAATPEETQQAEDEFKLDLAELFRLFKDGRAVRRRWQRWREAAAAQYDELYAAEIEAVATMAKVWRKWKRRARRSATITVLAERAALWSRKRVTSSTVLHWRETATAKKVGTVAAQRAVSSRIARRVARAYRGWHQWRATVERQRHEQEVVASQARTRVRAALGEGWARWRQHRSSVSRPAPTPTPACPHKSFPPLHPKNPQSSLPHSTPLTSAPLHLPSPAQREALLWRNGKARPTGR